MRRTIVPIALGLLALSSSAAAEERTPPFERIKDAVIRKIYSVERTHAFAINVGGGWGQEYTHDVQFGISYRYHPSNYIGVGLNFLGGLAFETGIVDEIRAQRPASLNNIRPETMRAVGTVDFHLVPIYGKFVAFGKYMVHYDLSLTIGAGVALVKAKALDGQTGVPEGSMRGAFTPAAGASLRMLFGKSAGLAAEFRDYIWSETGVGVAHHLSVTLGPVFVF
jgi:outer membrane beta-barrel protein